MIHNNQALMEVTGNMPPRSATFCSPLVSFLTQGAQGNAYELRDGTKPNNKRQKANKH